MFTVKQLNCTTMKKQVYLMLTALFLVFSTATGFAKEATPKSTLTPEQVELRISQIKQRVEEIRNMDRSTLSAAERQSLKSELRDMRKEAKAITSGGVYLSVGAIIIIILVLILIL